MSNEFRISALRHPEYSLNSSRWHEYRLTFKGGEEYLRRYLVPFDGETTTSPEFIKRRDMTPIATDAASAVTDIRNAIFQRLTDVVRRGGSMVYQNAVAGLGGGIDREGQSMNSFIGIDVLTELLVMGRVGVYVDNSAREAVTQADSTGTPYIYFYPVEDILNWKLMMPEEEGTFEMVLLRDHFLEFNTYLGLKLPRERRHRFRLVWVDRDDGFVYYKFFDHQATVPIRQDGQGGLSATDNPELEGAVRLHLRQIPFVMPSIGDSILTNVSRYQRAILNLASSDVYYAWKSNTPFLTIQDDIMARGVHLKGPPGRIADQGEPGGQRSADSVVRAGGTRGRYYAEGTDRPEYIAPPTAPLEASGKLQERMEDKVRKLINLAVQNKVGSRTESAEAKRISAQGLEAGLSHLALIMQHTESQISKFWTMYENNGQDKGAALVVYPNRYTLKDDSERIADAKAMLDLVDDVDSQTAKKEGQKQAMDTVFTGTVKPEVLNRIHKDIDKNKWVAVDEALIFQLVEKGLVGDVFAAEVFNIPDAKAEVERAREDKAERAVAVLEAQVKKSEMTGDGIENRAAARGVPDIDPNPDSGKEERAEDDKKRGKQKAPTKDEE